MSYSKPKTNLGNLAITRPAVTIFLIGLCLVVYFLSTSHGTSWIKDHSFTRDYFFDCLYLHQYWNLLVRLFWATFCQLTPWQLLANLYFLWIFGTILETRLGHLRYLIMVLICTLAGWSMLAVNQPLDSPVLYLSPGLMIFGLLGGYLNFLPEKKLSATGSIKQDYRIFNKEPVPDPIDYFSVSPWWVFSGFAICQTGLYFLMFYSSLHAANMRPLPALWTMVIGFLCARLLVMQSTGKIEGHPLHKLVVARYKELRKLDMNHEQSIHGAAILLSVPSDKVRKWVTESSKQGFAKKN